MSRLDRDHTGLLVIDVQERLFPLVQRSEEVGRAIQKAILGAGILELPVVVTQQYPQGLGPTVPYLRQVLRTDQAIWDKTTFSCWGSQGARAAVQTRSSWLVVGIEAHVCVLQTVRDLMENGLQPTVLGDAVSSRSLYDLASGLAEARELGARVSSIETVLFELLGDSRALQFKSISDLVKHP